MARPQVSVAFTERTTVWYSRLSPNHRALVDPRLRELALEPEGAPFREPGPLGVTRYIARIEVDDGEVSGYRVDYIVDQRMRVHLPAIVVVSARTMPYRR